MSDGHIDLRNYRPEDATAQYEAVMESIEELRRWNGSYRNGYTFDDSLDDVAWRIRRWNAGEFFSFVIEDARSHVFLGNCRIEEYEPEHHCASLGWWVRTTMTRRGIATAAARLVAQAGFEDLRLASLAVYANFDNTASRRVAEKIGAELVQIKREDDGTRCAVYRLLPTPDG